MVNACLYAVGENSTRLNVEALRELLQLAALLLVSGFELLMFHFQPLLLQHDLLVQTAQISAAASVLHC